MRRLAPLLALPLVAWAPPALAETPLIPRAVLFGNPETISPRLSPDGKRLAWLAPDVKGVMQIWVRTLGQKDDKAVTRDAGRGIRKYFWADNGKALLYMQDRAGDENWHLYGVELSSGNVRDYTPFQGIQAAVVDSDAERPDELLVSLNLRDRTMHDVYRLTLSTGALVLDTENPGDIFSFTPDASLRVRAATVLLPEGGTEIRIRQSERQPWKTWITAGPEEILDFKGFSADGQQAYLRSSIGSDTARMIVRDVRTGSERVLAQGAVDAEAALLHPRTHAPQAVSFAPDRTRWTVVDPAIAKDFKALSSLAPGDFELVSRDKADVQWLVRFVSDQAPASTYLWDRRTKAGKLLFSEQPKLLKAALAPQAPIRFQSRDGLTIHGYMTRPVGQTGPQPMVVYVHGGPWMRDTWGYEPVVQWLANRGYAVLQVNYRGSTGYGKAFLNAGNRQWGKKMHDDLIDAVRWAVKEGVADPAKVAIYGGSYGGYAALAGVTFTPEVFACAVDIVGPSNLQTLLATTPPYWKALKAMLNQRVGNVDDPVDAPLLKAASPVHQAHRIKRPLLIAQGANDVRVKPAESEQIVEAIARNGGQATYVFYPDEGHSFTRTENQLDLHARAERFLAEHLGGRFEPLEGEVQPGSSAVVRQIGR